VQSLSAHLARIAPAALPKAQESASPIDEAQLQEVTAQLRVLLQDMDSETGEWIRTHQALLRQAFPGHFQALAAAVEAFDFDVATEQLDAAMAALSGVTTQTAAP
jgi:hypothetical protein